MTLPSAFGLRRGAYWKGNMHHTDDVMWTLHQLTAIVFILFMGDLSKWVSMLHQDVVNDKHVFAVACIYDLWVQQYVLSDFDCSDC